MTKQMRRNYTAEFKREAVRLVTDEGYRVAVAARWVLGPWSSR
jgi:transposase-like protein